MVEDVVAAKKADVANQYGLICVSPSFTVSPWYGNHATDPRIRQEDYVVRVLLPYIEGNYPARNDREGRWLIGFSKSGWGAFTLLLRHPDVFGYAAAWDVPFMIDGDHSGDDWGPMGISAVMGTKENFQRGFVPTTLAVRSSSWLKDDTCRLVLGKGQFWNSQVEQMHGVLTGLGIPHVYRPDLLLPHRWDSGWFVPMLQELVKVARPSQAPDLRAPAAAR